ncbi:DUF6455 family protein [Paenirhodobacter sp. CAU 1674]|uniref:DUF6455 family protein n=1 Tax=Paenirhodobacter sp. CAU 1674 TaxID=3032596 RepID=UPI0023DBC8E1|nr:DUF6455 family protein [Paenirhodobacter sp. CAU 1674]MDF2141580.1 DUF6455 family protein [Paenirhodobacter sp. CAU 1674]
MFGARTLNRHAALMNRMAEVLGVDLTEAMAKGQLSGEGWREAVVRCTSCDDPTACQHWLAGHDGDEGAAEAPDYCNNRLMMARLRQAIELE